MKLTEEQQSNVPLRLKLWICCHCGGPRLYGSSTECKTCGALLCDTAEYTLLDSDSQVVTRAVQSLTPLTLDDAQQEKQQ